MDDMLRDFARDPELEKLLIEARPCRDVSALLYDLRAELQLTQRDLAARGGVTPSYVCQLESGTGNPSVKALDRLLRTVGFRLAISAVPNDPETAERFPDGITTGRDFLDPPVRA